MNYRCVATSPEGLVQQIAVSYLRHGYWWYVSGRIPSGKDAEQVDQKLISKYDIDHTERQRSVRKSKGLANVQYIRYQRWFCLLVSSGNHPIKQREQIRDCRRHPIRFEGYSLSYRRAGTTPRGGTPKWHSCVRIDTTTYRQLKTWLTDRAKHRKAATIIGDINKIPFARYAPVRRQILNLHRCVNRTRRQAGFQPIPISSLNLKRKIVRPFLVSKPNLQEVA